MRPLVAIVAFVALATASGCAEADPPEVDDSDAKADGVTRPVGTYTLPMERTDDSWGGIHLSLMTDRTFRREENLDPFSGVTVERGTYRYSMSGTRRYITFTFEDGRKSRFEYQLVDDNTALRLRTPDTSRWSRYEQDSARCDSDDDCELQGEPTGSDCYYSGCVTEIPE